MKCARCGVASCGGACGALPWLSSVTALFPYAGRHRSLLLASKEAQDVLCLEVFSEVYGRVAMDALERLIRQHKIKKIVLARLRLTRIASMDWHPTDFWLAHIAKLRREWKNSSISIEFPEVCTVVSLRWKKRALMSTLERQRRVKEFEIGQSHQPRHSQHANILVEEAWNTDFNQLSLKVENSSEEENLQEEGKQQECAVLILDDVLTSGGTLQSEWLDLREEMAHSFDLRAHALTLFRTPVQNPWEEHVP